MKIHDILSSSAVNYSDNIALNCDGISVTYRELKENVNNISKFLSNKGVTKNDNVAILMHNSIEFVESFFAINMCEAIILPIYINMGRRKLVDVFNYYNIKYLITFDKYNHLFDESLLRICP